MIAAVIAVLALVSISAICMLISSLLTDADRSTLLPLQRVVIESCRLASWAAIILTFLIGVAALARWRY